MVICGTDFHLSFCIRVFKRIKLLTNLRCLFLLKKGDFSPFFISVKLKSKPLQMLIL